MLHIKQIKHADLTNEMLLAICKIKMSAWPYNLESQQKWIRDNLLEDDQHVLLYDNNNLVAYLNLVNIEFTLNNQLTHGWGIGNVCAVIKGHGYGGELIKGVNDFLLKHNKSGILFCNENLLNFYLQFNWMPLPRELITFQKLNKINFETMIFNVTEPIKCLVYGDRLF